MTPADFFSSSEESAHVEHGRALSSSSASGSGDFYVGHRKTEALFLDAYRNNRLPHALLLTGSEGVGKATFALRAARFILSHPDPSSPAVIHARDLYVSPENAEAKLIAARSHSDLFFLETESEGEKKTKSGLIRVDDVRDMLSFFGSTAGKGGWKVAIIDSVDDLNRNSANALLKMLEEPPPRSLFLMVSHRPGKLMPTIRSRSQVYRFKDLSDDELHIILKQSAQGHAMETIESAAAYGQGSIKQSMKYLDEARLAMITDIEATLDRLPEIDRKHMLSMADHFSKKDGNDSFMVFLEVIENWIMRRCKENFSSPGVNIEALTTLWEKIQTQSRLVDIYNLDRRPFFLSLMNDLADATKSG